MKKQILFFTSFLSFCFATTMWAGGAEDERWLLDFDNYEYFFKYYEDIENVRLYFALTLE